MHFINKEVYFFPYLAACTNLLLSSLSSWVTFSPLPSALWETKLCLSRSYLFCQYITTFQLFHLIRVAFGSRSAEVTQGEFLCHPAWWWGYEHAAMYVLLLPKGTFAG